MSDHHLSQSQVASLLRAMQTGADAAADGELGAGATEPWHSGGARSAAAEPPAPSEPGITPYDFKQRQPLSAEQLRHVRALHAALADRFGSAASGLLRSVVQCKLLSACQRTYGDFIAELESPSCLHVLAAYPLEGAWLLEITPALAYPVVDRLLGGDPEPSGVPRRELTEIETRLLRRWVNLFLTQTAQAWQPITPLQLAVDRVESDPRLALLAPAGEAVLAICWEVVVGRSRGLMNLCIPAASLAGLERSWAGNDFSESAETQPTDATRQTIVANVHHATVELSVTLARSKIRTAELLDLAVGDVITTEQEVGASLELSVQGTPRFLARPGAYRGRKAVCIQGLIRP